MLILPLLEAKFVDQEYAYHATKGDYLSSILKHGLVPNRSAGGYGSEQSSPAGYSMQALQGVYFTRVANSAKQIAKEAQGKLPSVIIVAKLQPRSMTMDEDDIASDFIQERLLVDKITNFAKSQPDKTLSPGQIDHEAGTHTDRILKSNAFLKFDDRMKENIRPTLFAYIKSLIEFVLRTESGDFGDQKTLKANQLELTKKLRQLTHKSPIHAFGKTDTFKIDVPVGFRGSNRIVGVYCPDTRLGWGDIGALQHDAYHVYDDNPTKIFKGHDAY